mmetsp:Transcript_7074/g.20875  ORF Transcript_7074/g.20875 Transcript_7074/m.20875 type:complete len:346 (-) Transcript_7074:367-1404(-)
MHQDVALRLGIAPRGPPLMEQPSGWYVVQPDDAGLRGELGNVVVYVDQADAHHDRPEEEEEYHGGLVRGAARPLQQHRAHEGRRQRHEDADGQGAVQHVHEPQGVDEAASHHHGRDDGALRDFHDLVGLEALAGPGLEGLDHGRHHEGVDAGGHGEHAQAPDVAEVAAGQVQEHIGAHPRAHGHHGGDREAREEDEDEAEADVQGLPEAGGGPPVHVLVHGEHAHLDGDRLRHGAEHRDGALREAQEAELLRGGRLQRLGADGAWGGELRDDEAEDVDVDQDGERGGAREPLLVQVAEREHAGRAQRHPEVAPAQQPLRVQPVEGHHVERGVRHDDHLPDEGPEV